MAALNIGGADFLLRGGNYDLCERMDRVLGRPRRILARCIAGVSVGARPAALRQSRRRCTDIGLSLCNQLRFRDADFVRFRSCMGRGRQCQCRIRPYFARELSNLLPAD